jgi:hypothetical protein
MLLAATYALGCRGPSDQRSPARAVDVHSDSEQRWCEEIDSAGACTLYGPSLLTLIARPEIFAGKVVRLICFVHFQFEDNGLYVSRDSYENGIDRNGLWIDRPIRRESDSATARRQPNDRYVIVEGTFNARDQGHLGMWSGHIENVTRLEAWERPTTPKFRHLP